MVAKDNFCHLHTHSSYSYTDGYGLPKQYIERAVEMGQPGIGVTDHGNISAHFKWYNACNDAGITPVLGIEFYVSKDLDTALNVREYWHMTVLVQNNVGYKNMMTLVTKSWCEQFYYKPKITIQDLIDHQEGLIVLSGCLSSPIMRALKENHLDLADEFVNKFNDNIDNFYIEVQPIHFPEGKPAYERLLKLYKEKWSHIPMVATSDCHYVKEEHNTIQEILLCIQTNTTMDDPNRWKFDQDDFYLKSREEMEESLNTCFPDFDFTDALDESVRIMESIDFVFPKAEPIRYPIPEEEKIPLMKKMCEEGMHRRGLKGDAFDLAGITEKEYQERLDYELDLIIQKDYVDYFLAINDIVKWSKEQGILVGPARGSAAGSLACYVLDITEVEPLRYGLIFERFIDLNRMDLPDIDIDFEDVRRNEVKQYIEDKYGADKVGTLPVYTTFKGKSAIDDIGRCYRIPFPVLNDIKKAIIERSGGDSRASFTLEDTFTSDIFEAPKEAMKKYPELKHTIELEGQIRQIGKHAAGMVVSNEPITDFCALYKIKDQQVISMDYKDASETGLLKLDLLGLNTLSVIRYALEMIKERTGKDIDIYKLKLDDPAVYKGFCDGRLFGIFQFDGQAINQVCRQIMPHDFESLSAISALGRPGPLNSGSTTMYIQRRAGRQKVEYAHPVMEPYTKETYGIVVYQEQVMKTMRELGKMSWKDTSEIRKLISRSQGVEKFNTFKDKFAVGAEENGMNEKQIDTIWDSICTFGSWAFNKSHSVSYTIISYWTMWLKVHYPMEFYSAIMTLTADDTKRKKILKEYLKEGFTLLPVDINKSKEHFSIDGDSLRIGFGDVKGMGTKAAEFIIGHQPFSSYEDYMAKTKKHFSIKQLENMSSANRTLIDLGAFDNIPQSERIDLFGNTPEWFVKEELDFAKRFELCPWDVDFGLDKNWLPLIQENISYFKKEPMPIENLREQEGADDVVIYGMIYDKNLRDAREVSLSKGKDFDIKKYNIVKLLDKKIRKNFRGNEYISKWALSTYEKRIGHKLTKGIHYELEDQFQFANFVIEDDTDFITVRLSHIAFPTYGKMIFELDAGDPVIIKGKMGSGIRMLFANKIISLKDYKDGKSKINVPKTEGTEHKSASRE